MSVSRMLSPPGNTVSRWTGDLWSKRILVIWLKRIRSFLERFDEFLCLKNMGFCVFANKPTVHSGEVSRGGSLAVAVAICNW